MRFAWALVRPAIWPTCLLRLLERSPPGRNGGPPSGGAFDKWISDVTARNLYPIAFTSYDVYYSSFCAIRIHSHTSY
jgi:hypothetical protein